MTFRSKAATGMAAFRKMRALSLAEQRRSVPGHESGRCLRTANVVPIRMGFSEAKALVRPSNRELR